MAELDPSIAFILEDKATRQGEQLVEENGINVFRFSQQEIKERPLDFIRFFHNHHPRFTFVEVISDDSMQVLETIGKWNLTRSSQVVPLVDDEALQQKIEEITTIRPFRRPLRRDGAIDFLQRHLLSSDAISRR